MSHEFNKHMCEILGLSDETVWFELRCEVNKPPIITSEQYVVPFNIIDDARIETVLKRYELVEKEDLKVNIAGNGCVSDDLDKAINEESKNEISALTDEVIEHCHNVMDFGKRLV